MGLQPAAWPPCCLPCSSGSKLCDRNTHPSPPTPHARCAHPATTPTFNFQPPPHHTLCQQRIHTQAADVHPPHLMPAADPRAPPIATGANTAHCAHPSCSLLHINSDQVPSPPAIPGASTTLPQPQQTLPQPSFCSTTTSRPHPNPSPGASSRPAHPSHHTWCKQCIAPTPAALPPLPDVSSTSAFCPSSPPHLVPAADPRALRPAW